MGGVRMSVKEIMSAYRKYEIAWHVAHEALQDEGGMTSDEAYKMLEQKGFDLEWFKLMEEE